MTILELLTILINTYQCYHEMKAVTHTANRVDKLSSIINMQMNLVYTFGSLDM